ncbi:hypothetical protein ACG02S_08610 [Roseateles sp. DC23W]|uniref:TonB C-terminal domain-containing protein n=1 Tax=Pelomonas dachongensis TaxID=3299029 RepID=A0ABW7EPJ7_9BURK
MSYRSELLISACLLAGLMQAAAASDLPRKRYEIRVEETGTRLGRVAIRSSLPLNRRYAELDEAERALIRAEYEGMPAADEPPFPAQGLLPIFNAIQDGMDKLFPSGAMTVVADVDSEGKVRHVDVFGDVQPEFARFSSAVLMVTPFKPGFCGGKPCNMQYVLRMQFSKI